MLAVSSLKETNDYQMYKLKVQNWAVYKLLFLYLPHIENRALSQHGKESNSRNIKW
jgi:hypothetical protein